MATFSKVKLSESTLGKAILVGATTTPGTSIHTTLVSATTIDEVWLYAVNTDTASKKLTIEWGGVTSPTDLIEFTVQPENGLYVVIPGLILLGDGTTGTPIRAWCATASVVTITGYVNRIAS